MPECSAPAPRFWLRALTETSTMSVMMTPSMTALDQWLRQKASTALSALSTRCRRLRPGCRRASEGSRGGGEQASAGCQKAGGLLWRPRLQQAAQSWPNWPQQRRQARIAHSAYGRVLRPQAQGRQAAQPRRTEMSGVMPSSLSAPPFTRRAFSLYSAASVLVVPVGLGRPLVDGRAAAAAPPPVVGGVWP